MHQEMGGGSVTRELSSKVPTPALVDRGPQNSLTRQGVLLTPTDRVPIRLRLQEGMQLTRLCDVLG